MRINNKNNNYNNQNFKALSQVAKPLGQFYNANATIPTLVIETGVTLGRAHEAKKRGGTPEAIDRLVEQGISAVVWIYGVKFLKNIGDFLGKKFLNIKDLNFDIGFDELRNPTKYINKKALGFKASNILISTAIATYFIGSILPKMNNAILDKILKKNKKEEEKTKQNSKQTTLKQTTLEEFKNKTKKNNLSFTSLFSTVVNGAHILENNSAARLLITDTGVIAGRFHNAPNKYRKIEGLFRDIASIYFYLLATSHIVFGLNKITKNTDINPKALEKTLEMLSQKIKENPDMKVEDFLSQATKKADDISKTALDELFKGKKVISVDDFIKTFPELSKKAKDMAAMQYIENGNGVLSYQQALDALSTSWTSEADFLKETLKYATGKEIDSKTCFVSSRELNKMRKSIDSFIENLSEPLKQHGKLDFDFIEKYANKTLKKSFGFNVVGTAISMYALGILIPKIQYAITRKLTNENKFHTEKD